MWTDIIKSCSIFSVPLRVILLCGILGVLIDIDHPIAYYWLRNLRLRFLHTPILIVGCAIFCIACTCAGRLLYKTLLKG